MKNLSSAFYTFLAVVCFSSCTPLDTSLNGKILTDEDGNLYKLEWQEGYGATWAFKYPVERVSAAGDTIVVWEYYR